MSFSDVIREFQRRGIGDEDQIAEHVAFLLLAYQHDPNSWNILSTATGAALRRTIEQLEDQLQRNANPLFPEPIPVDAWTDSPAALIAALRELLPANGDLGTFFQQQVRYYLLRGSRGERYPTPNHIAFFMAQLAFSDRIVFADEIKRLFDPTTGTGGLLVAAHQLRSEFQLIGCDYNARWARLAYANLRLQGIDTPQIYAQAAQQFRQPRTYERYDYVLMNPPFDSAVVTELLKLAINSLDDGGRAALLAPSGVVQRTDDYTELLPNGLQAIITLPDDAFRPYNGIRSHILLIDKAQRDVPIWLCALQADGYGTGMSRPLDQPMYPQPSELPRTLDLLGQRTVWSSVLSLAGDHQLEIAVLNPHKGDRPHPSGCAVRFSGTNAQPATWAAYVGATGALLWWEEQEFLQAETYLYATYDDVTKVPLQRSQVAEVTWVNALSTDVQTIITNEWQGPESSNISLSWTAATLTLKKTGSGRFADLSFLVDGAAVSGALLLNESGIPVSAWYHAALSENAETAINSAGQSLKDLQGNVVAWLLPFTAGEESLTLLLTKGATVTLFAPTEHAARYGLLHEAATEETPEKGGMWSIGEGRLATSNGRRLNTALRTADGKAVGIAFGPQAENREEASLFALCLECTTLAQRPLEPERYLPEARPPETLQHPAQILAQIRKQQRSMDRRMDALLSALSQDLAPAFVDEMPLPIPLISALNETQRTFWQRLASCTDPYLTFAQVEMWGQEAELTPVEVRQQVELLLSLGLLLPVTIAAGEQIDGSGSPNKQVLQPLYRCVRQSDIKVVSASQDM